jgi:aromatic ring hydroxylase
MSLTSLRSIKVHVVRSADAFYPKELVTVFNDLLVPYGTAFMYGDAFDYFVAQSHSFSSFLGH